MAKKCLLMFATTSACCFIMLANDLFNSPMGVLLLTLLGGVFFTGLIGIVWALAQSIAPEKAKKFQEMLESEE